MWPAQQRLAWAPFELRGMRPERSVLLSASLGAPAGGGGVQLDPTRAAQLWEAVRTDSVGPYGQQNPADVLGAVAR